MNGTIALRAENIYRGSLILVNREYGYRERKEDLAAPGREETAQTLMQRRAALLLDSLMEVIGGWREIVPVSGWRSYREQKAIWEESLAESGREFTEKYVALPGHSEHQTGLAIDLGKRQEEIDFIRPDFPYTGICQSFRKKAAEYGFIERYPAGKEQITGIGHEPWHFRYVGIPHARIMQEKEMTLEEYISFIRQFPYGEAAYCVREGGREIEVSYLKAKEGCTRLELDPRVPYAVSGNNVDGFILTQWRNGQSGGQSRRYGEV